jgi:hypothetical protein
MGICKVPPAYLAPTLPVFTSGPQPSPSKRSFSIILPDLKAAGKALQATLAGLAAEPTAAEGCHTTRHKQYINHVLLVLRRSDIRGGMRRKGE